MINSLRKGPITLHRLRVILAILIALSLSLAPVNSAWAAMQMRASMGTDAVVSTVSDDAMSDCMKAMQAQKSASGSACACCDAPSQAPCADVGACLAKCSAQVIAMMVAAVAVPYVVDLLNDRSDPPKPPDWAGAPPAPPPRA